eukprot:TRINITY_DN5815_c0_g1_i2.p1 TRINITY_DN5815_c0_g1~~TRINITY_DN5815_c0_g1_i2.p1  ORF type:complete len:348 (+),score=42.43 TRINITY_DN5815_c0_g1_i2:50-1045(+)
MPRESKPILVTHNSSSSINGSSNGKRSAFRKFARRYGSDYILLVLCAIATLAMYLSPPLPTRLFMVGIGDNRYASADIAYPKRPEIFTTVVTGAISFIGAFLGIIILQYWVRSKRDMHHATLGLMVSLMSASLFQTTIKWTIGGTRPNFLSICQPDMTKVLSNGVGFGSIYYDRSICTGDPSAINDALQSFPSGHAVGAYAGFLFLSFYLNGKLKAYCKPYRMSFWKVLVVMTPFLLGTLMTLSRLVDYSHHWYDILAGSVIGIFGAFVGYGSQYMAIFDPRINHLPCKKRSAPFSWKWPEIEPPTVADLFGNKTGPSYDTFNNQPGASQV